jgi:hypothetical protein
LTARHRRQRSTPQPAGTKYPFLAIAAALIGLLLVTLDDIGIPKGRGIGIAAFLAQGTTLAQQIPALVEGDLDRLESLAVEVSRRSRFLSAPELVLLADEFLYAVVNLSVVHAPHGTPLTSNERYSADLKVAEPGPTGAKSPAVCGIEVGVIRTA